MDFHRLSNENRRNNLEHYNVMKTTRPLLISLVMLTTPAMADEFSITPRMYLDIVGYKDTADGQGTGYIQNTNGIFNVHSDAPGGGHSHGGSLHSGLNFRGADLSLSAAYGDWLTGRFNFVTDGRSGGVEEAWLKARSAPSGLAIKGGKFLSDIGWQNYLHPHGWDFVDQALPYQLLFAGGLAGNGAQVSWQPALPFTLQLGAELLSAGNESVAATVGPITNYTSTSGKVVDIPFSTKGAWPNLWTFYAKAGVPIAPQHTVYGGVSYIKSELHQELHTYHPGINDADHGLEGRTQTAGLSLGYQFNAEQEHGHGDVTLEGEYFYQRKDLLLNFHETKPWNVGQPRVLNVDSYYVQALYGVAPRWQLGLRYDVAGNIQEALRSSAPLKCAPPYQAMACPRVDSKFDGLSRLSAVVTWAIDDRQKLRLQLSLARVPVAEDINGDNRADALRKNFTQAFLQYQVVLGAAPKHSHQRFIRE